MSRGRFPTAILACLVVALSAASSLRADDAAPKPLGPTDLHPTLVTIHQKRAAIKDVLDELQKQSGIKLTMQWSPDAKVTIDADNQPFWKVLSDACDQASVGPSDGNWGDMGILIQNAQPDPAHRIIAGPVMLHLGSVERIELLTAPIEQQDFCDLQAWGRWEPRLSVAYFENYSLPTIAVDENGTSLIAGDDVVDPRNPGIARLGVPEMYGNESAVFQHSIRLKIPAGAGRRIAHLAGQVRVWVIDKTAAAEIADLTAAQKSKPTLRAGGQELMIQNVWTGPTNVELQVFIKKHAEESADAWQQRQSMMHAIKGHIDDSDGKPWCPDGNNQNGFGMQGEEAYYYLNFQRADGLTTSPKKLTLDVPTSAAEIDIPYDLKDLPLP